MTQAAVHGRESQTAARAEGKSRWSASITGQASSRSPAGVLSRPMPASPTRRRRVLFVTTEIADFIKAVEPVGRAEFGETEDLTLSVVAPDQYRGAVADAIAADARTMAAKLGPDYGVEIEGLNRPVEWARASLSEVLLYIPYKLVVVPKR